MRIVADSRIAKERSGFSGPAEDHSKFDNPWRRDGPLPPRDSSRRRYDMPAADRHPSSVADETNDWRSGRPSRASESEVPPFKRKGSGLLSFDTQVSPAEKEDVWAIGSKFRPSISSSNDDTSNKFGSVRGRNDVAPAKDSPNQEPDWRSAARSRPTKSSVSRKNCLDSALEFISPFR